jgi:hypothetical protein
VKLENFLRFVFFFDTRMMNLFVQGMLILFGSSVLLLSM